MSDPQFGMFTKDASFEHETVNFEFAIATATASSRHSATSQGPAVACSTTPDRAAPDDSPQAA
jgi:hypothetical protein